MTVGKRGLLRAGQASEGLTSGENPPGLYHFCTSLQSLQTPFDPDRDRIHPREQL